MSVVVFVFDRELFHLDDNKEGEGRNTRLNELDSDWIGFDQESPVIEKIR